MGKQVQKKQTSSNFMITTILIMMILMLLGVVYTYKANQLQIDALKQIVEEKNKETGNQTQVTQEEQEVTKPIICQGNLEGVYYGEFSGQVGNFTLVEKQTMTFNNNGTYTRTYENGGGSTGNYIVNDGTIVLSYVPLGAPSTYKITETLSISSDCSTIAIKGEGYNYNLIKQ